jgi:hypothetical protein
VTGPDLFLPQSEDPTEPPTVVVASARRRRFSRRRIAIGAALLAVLVGGGMAVALLIPGGSFGGAVAAFEGRPVDGGQQAAAPAPAPAPAGGRQRGQHGDGRDRLGADTLLVGKLVSTGTGTLVVAQDNGATLTVHTNEGTKVLGAGKKGLAGLTAGDRVVVRVSGTGDAAAAVTVRSPKAHVTGTVTALAGDAATVLRADGLAESVNVAAVNPKPAVGALVVLSGTADGSTLTADRMRPLPKAS